jgi:FtsP/CotA-like multicopper oxidase with cupredoxin domain
MKGTWQNQSSENRSHKIMKRSNNTLLTAALVCGSALVVALQAQAAHTVYLSAESFTKTLPGGKQVLMWGYKAQDSTFGAVGVATSPGPAIVVPPGETQLQIVLSNNLAGPTSLVIPGQNGFVRDPLDPAQQHSTFTDAQGRVRARSFVKEAAPGAVVTYTWNNVTPGTYLYHSGSHAALQVQMGLFGAVTKNSSATEVYPGKAVGGQVTLLLSEIDTKVHDAVQSSQYGPGLAMSSTIKSVPDYFLINGDAYPDAAVPLAVAQGQTVLVRLLNAGNNERVPTLNGQYLTLIAEDGRLYPGARQQFAPLLPALKTMDALWTAPSAAGQVVVYDRRLGLVNALTPDGGMIKKIRVN